MTADDFQLVTIPSAPFDENSYVAYRTGHQQCLIFDPGLEPERILDAVAGNGLTPAAILLTHGHADHIAGNRALKQKWPDCPLLIGRGDADKLTDASSNLSAKLGLPLTSPPADQLLDDGELLTLAGFELLVHEIPGHSVGHVVYIWREHRPMYVFGGDVLFAGSVGRTDFPGGSMPQLAKGIHRHLFTLPATPSCCQAMASRQPLERRRGRIRLSAGRRDGGEMMNDEVGMMNDECLPFIIHHSYFIIRIIPLRGAARSGAFFFSQCGPGITLGSGKVGSEATAPTCPLCSRAKTSSATAMALRPLGARHPG